VIDDITTDREFSPFKAVAERAGFRAVQSTPLMSSNGAVVGIISTHGDCSPNRHHLEQIKSLAQETANELIRLRAHLSVTHARPYHGGRKLISTPEQDRDRIERNSAAE
jgi:GAF domain-containing protein